MTSMKARFRASLNPLVVAFLVSCGAENLGPVGSDSGGADGSGGAGGTGTSGGDLVVGTYGDGGLTETSGPPADAGPCDPLAPHELPVILGKVLGVGKGSTSTLYLADEAPATYQYRVFVSQGNVLWRKRVMGSGSNGGRRRLHIGVRGWRKQLRPAGPDSRRRDHRHGARPGRLARLPRRE